MLYYQIIILYLTKLCLSQPQSYPWTKPSNLNQGLPPSIQIFTLNTTDSPFATKLTGGYARFNMNDTNLQLIVKNTNQNIQGYSPKTPEQYAEAEQNVVYAVINGGYFNRELNVSSSFVCQGGIVKNRNQINQDENNHPTVGAFGMTKTGRFEIQYIYSFGQNLNTYKFRHPNQFPGPIPNKNRGKLWRIKEGIGAGPILVKNRSIISENVQNFDYEKMISTRHPRSAICIDDQNRIYFVAIDGRYSGSDGLYMSEIAHLMQSLGCIHAMNLDGGGSTNLFANGNTINRPSDASGPRPVVSALLIRDRNKKKQQHNKKEEEQKHNKIENKNKHKNFRRFQY